MPDNGLFREFLYIMSPSDYTSLLNLSCSIQEQRQCPENNLSMTQLCKNLNNWETFLASQNVFLNSNNSNNVISILFFEKQNNGVFLYWQTIYSLKPTCFV